MLRKFNSLILTRITSILHEEQLKFMIISRSVLLGMSIVSEKCCRENQNTHFMFSNSFSENRTTF